MIEQALEFLRDPATPAVLAIVAPTLCAVALIRLWWTIRQSDYRLEALDAGQVELLAMMDRERRILAKFVANGRPTPGHGIQFQQKREPRRQAPTPQPHETIVQPLRKTVH